MRMRSDAPSLYVHIPFCRQICSYCDFAKVIYNPKRIDAYFKSLFFELKTLKKHPYRTIYIGGGTPSCIPLPTLKKLLKKLRPLLQKSSYEFTIECNVEDINEKLLALLVRYGVNRLSCGVQTFQDHLIRLCNRRHDREMVFQHIQLASQYITNISVDMIYAFPGQTFEQLKEDVRLVLSLPIQHLSYYSLQIEENTILKARHYENIDEAVQAEFYEYLYQQLQQNGFKRYEISNFSKPGYQSQHNLTYWHNENYDAIGLHASGYIDNIRYQNTRNIEKYIHRNYEREQIPLSLAEIQFEEIMLRLRLDEGIDLRQFQQKYHVDFLHQYATILQKLKTADLLTWDETTLKTTQKGSLLLNDILIEFLN